MLNLTPEKICIIAESGEETTYEPSGYVARVEITRRKVGHATIPGQRVAKAIGAPIIEEVPTEIILLDDLGRQFNIAEYLLAQKLCDGKDTSLLLVKREVAEAAAYRGHIGHGKEANNGICLRPQCGPHPLWRRMVWAADFNGLSYQYAAYKALQRVPQGDGNG